jgi:hypothetical protein
MNLPRPRLLITNATTRQARKSFAIRPLPPLRHHLLR